SLDETGCPAYVLTNQRPKTKDQRPKTKDQRPLYRSISPNTMSSDPIIATMSATIAPSDMSGSAERFTKLGPRKCTRDGLGPPSDFTYTPSSPFDASIGW